MPPPSLRRADLLLARLLGRLGRQVARQPGLALALPLLLSALLATGLRTFFYISDESVLFVPTHARAHTDRAVIERLFPDNYTEYVPGATTGLPRHVMLHLVPRPGSSALGPDLWREAAALAGAVRQIRVRAAGRELGWTDLCAQFEGKCVDNSFLELAEEPGLLGQLGWPVHLQRRADRGDRWFPLPAHLGGAKAEAGRWPWPSLLPPSCPGWWGPKA
jgi:hypothetical protein